MSNSTSRKLAHNTLWATGAELISRFILFAVVVQLANYLHATGYGLLSYAFALANICVVLADFGLTTYVVQQLPRNLENTKSYLGKLLGLKIILSLLSFGCMVLAGVLLPRVSLSVIMLGGLAIILSNLRMFLESFFRAHQRMELEAFTKTSSAIILAITISWLIFQHSTLFTIALGYCIASVLSIIITIIIVQFKISPITLTLSPTFLKNTLFVTWPFAFSIACNYLLNYLDSAMLGFLNQSHALGWYNAAYKPIFFLTALAGMIINAFFPVISKQFHHQRSQVVHTVQQLLKVNLTIAIPLAIGGSVIASPLMHLLYTDSSYNNTIITLTFQILLLSTCLIYIWAAFGNSLQACDQQKIYLRGFAWAALINALANIIFIPAFSLYGAASTTLLAQLFLVFFMRRHFQTQIGKIHFWKTVWPPLFSSCAMGIVLLRLPIATNWLVLLFNILISMLTYGAVLLIVGGLKREELVFLRNLFKRAT